MIDTLTASATMAVSGGNTEFATRPKQSSGL
jgi:hypothetical protein